MISFVVSIDLLATAYGFLTSITVAIATELARHTGHNTFADRSRFRSTVAGRRRTRTIGAERARGYRRVPDSTGRGTTKSCTATRKRQLFHLDGALLCASLKGNAHSASASIRLDGR